MKIIDTRKNKKTTTFEIKVDSKNWKMHQEKTMMLLGKKINVPGFRKGHVPKNIIALRISKQEIFDHALRPCIDGVYKNLIEQKEFLDVEVIEDTPKLDIKKINENELEVSFEFENFPDIKLPDCEKIKLDGNKHTVSDKEVENELDKLVQKDTMLSSKKSDTIENGDYVVFDFRGSVDGKYFPGGEARDYQLKIGSESFIPGFEKQMIGLKKGEEKIIEVPFPEDYHEKSLAGKLSKFEIKIDDIKTAITPEINDKFVKDLGIDDVDTVAKLKTFIKKQMLGQKEAKDQQKHIKTIANYITKGSKLEFVPESLLDSEKQRLKNEVKQEAAKTKTTIGEYAKQYLNVASEEELEKKIEENAINNLTLVIAFNKLSKKYDIKVTEKEIDDYIKNVAQMYKTNYKTMKEQLKNKTEQIEVQLNQEKLFAKLIELNKK